MRAFIIRPFGVKEDRKQQPIDFNRVASELIDGALDDLGISGRDTQDILEAGNIRLDMFRRLMAADLVIADISIHNANVFYELGIRHALREKRTFMIRCQADDVVFDLLTDRYLVYDRANPGAQRGALKEALRHTLDSDQVDSPVYGLLPELRVHVPFLELPVEFAEEVDTARKRGRRGDLTLLAQECLPYETQTGAWRGFEWQTEGLRVVGKAQMAIKDCAGARTTWEAVRATAMNDLEANLMLAEIYCQLAAGPTMEATLALSDQAIKRVWQRDDLTGRDRGEACYLLANNKWKRWVQSWSALAGDVRSEALRRAYAQKVFDDYERCLREDLGHFRAGVRAAALRALIVDLARDLPAIANKLSAEPGVEMLRFAKRRDQLLGAATLSLEAGRRRQEDADTVDAALLAAEAELQLLTPTAGGVDAAFHALCDTGDEFVIGALDERVRIYQRLGVFAANVQDALAVLDARPRPVPPPRRVLLFGGHLADPPGAPASRFPPDEASERKAVDAIKAAVLDEIRAAGDAALVRALAGGACGGDLCFHAVCTDLGIRDELYMLSPRDAFVRDWVQRGGPRWVQKLERLHDALSTDNRVAQLLESDDLPRWLRAKFDSDELRVTYRAQRGNWWLLFNALASGEGRVTLITLSDPQAGAVDGAAHLVELARQKGVRTIELSARQVFGLT
jgi:hypothetical protein